MRFFELVGLKLKDSKTEKGPPLTILGVFAEFTGPRNEMTLTIPLPSEKFLRLPLKLREFSPNGTIGHKELEGVIGKLPFAQTSIYGLVGRATMTSLYQKLNAEFYV